MGKQKIQAKRAYSKREYRVSIFFCFIVFGSFEPWSVLNWEAKITEFGGIMQESSTWLSRRATLFPPDFAMSTFFPFHNGLLPQE